MQVLLVMAKAAEITGLQGSVSQAGFITQLTYYLQMLFAAALLFIQLFWRIDARSIVVNYFSRYSFGVTPTFVLNTLEK
jgi:hypothetical protein